MLSSIPTSAPRMSMMENCNRPDANMLQKNIIFSNFLSLDLSEIRFGVDFNGDSAGRSSIQNRGMAFVSNGMNFAIDKNVDFWRRKAIVHL